MRLAVAALAAALALPAAAQAQTWGQPIYVTPYGHPVGGTPLSEVETRSYVETGRWADGYTDQAYVYVPAPVYGGHQGGYAYGHGGYGNPAAYRPPAYGYGYSRYGYSQRYRSGYAYARPHPSQSRVGYRDRWGYNDDRPPSSWDRARERDCSCGDVYLYDR